MTLVMWHAKRNSAAGRGPAHRGPQGRGHGCGKEDGVRMLGRRVRAAIARGQALMRDRGAVTALEYGIIASILGLVLVSIFTRFGTTLSTLFSSVGTKI